MSGPRVALGRALLFGLTASAVTGCGSGTSAGAIHPSARQVAYVEAIARSEGSQYGRHITAGAFQVVTGTQDEPNVGPACGSGTLLNLVLIGTFPHDMVSAPPPLPGQPPRDNTVRALAVTADGVTGKPCLLGDTTGHPHIDPVWTRISVR